MKFIQNKKGQGLVEYMVIVALMAIATMGIMRVLSQTTSAKIAKISQTLQGGKNKIDITESEINKTDFRKKDMSDFFKGSRSSR